MIPRIIHYCWFGGKPLPKSAKKCIESWKKYFPDYEIKRWDESNYDVGKIKYTRDAYKFNKYAFVSDYARFDILYNYGGIYFDVDVEVVKSFEKIIKQGPFMGCENEYLPLNNPQQLAINPGLGMGAKPGMSIFKVFLDHYENLKFVINDNLLNLSTVVDYTSDILGKHGLRNTHELQVVEGITIYPKDYFCPISTVDGKLRITSNTYSIHHYNQSWQSPLRKYGRKIILFLGGAKLKMIVKNMLLK